MLPKETIKIGERVWKHTHQSYADCFIYRDGDDLALVNKEGEVEHIFPDANRLINKYEID